MPPCPLVGGIEEIEKIEKLVSPDNLKPSTLDLTFSHGWEGRGEALQTH